MAFGNFGGIEVLEQPEATQLPQRAASAAAAIGNIVGAKYKVISYVGSQIVKGVNHVFLAQQTPITLNPDRHIVLIKVNEFDGEYTLVSIETIV